jgi:hypothetical protein
MSAAAAGDDPELELLERSRGLGAGHLIRAGRRLGPATSLERVAG